MRYRICETIGQRSNDGTSMGHRYRFREITIFYVFLSVILISGVTYAQHVAVYVDSAESSPGECVPVRVLIDNDFPVASIIVPLNYPTDYLIPDSVTFHGSVVNPDQQYLAVISYDSNLVRILVLPTVTTPIPIIYDPGGLLATIWFSISPFADECFIEIDTIYVYDSICFGANCFYYCPIELQAADAIGTQLYPDFTSGGVAIRSRRE